MASVNVPEKKDSNGIDLCIDFMKKNKKRDHLVGKVAFAEYVSGHLFTMNTGGCHARLQKVSKGARKAIASEICCSSGFEESTEAVIEWIFSPTESPWKKITSHGIQILYDEKDKYPYAWVMDYSKVDVPENFLKNFCIATRSIGERKGNWKFWHKLVKKGIDRIDAVYMASYFALNHQNSISQNFLNMGGHWPFSDMQDGYFSFRKLKNPDQIQNDGTPVNGWWTEQRRAPSPQFNNITSSMIKTKFSHFKSLNEDSILDMFYKWKDQACL